MATFIKVDNKFINLDNVTEIHSYELNGWNVIVYYNAVTTGEDGKLLQDFEHFTGEDALAIRRWLEHQAVDVIHWHRDHSIATNGHKEKEYVMQGQTQGRWVEPF